MTKKQEVEYNLVGGAVRDLFIPNQTVVSTSDFDVLVVGSDYKELLYYLIAQSNVQIFVPEARYINLILADSFTSDLFDRDNANWNSYKTGVIKCKVNGKDKVDYALARKECDNDYTNNSVVPEGVIINSSVTLLEDLSRRDFTQNSMVLPLNNPINLFSYNIKELYDPFNGLKDISNKVINTVGKPMDRFIADPTRVLRLIKFMLRFGFEASIEIKTALDNSLNKEQIEQLINSYKLKINNDRTGQELKHIFNSTHNVYEAISLMYNLLPKELLNVIFNDNVYLQPTVIHNK